MRYMSRHPNLFKGWEIREYKGIRGLAAGVKTFDISVFQLQTFIIGMKSFVQDSQISILVSACQHGNEQKDYLRSPKSKAPPSLDIEGVSGILMSVDW